MDPNAKLVFDTPDWPEVLRLAGAAAMLLEVLAMFWRRRSWGNASRPEAPHIPPHWGLGGVAMALTPVPILAAFTLLGGQYLGRWGTTLAAGLAGMILASVAGIMAMLSSGKAWRALAIDCLLGAALSMFACGIYFWPVEGSIAALAFCGPAWAIRSYGRTTSPIRRGIRISLLAARILAILLLLGWLARPALEYQRYNPVPSVVVIGFDSSSSMQRRDMPSDYLQEPAELRGEAVTRAQALQQALHAQERELWDLTEQGDVDFFTFSTAARSHAMVPSHEKSWRTPKAGVLDLPPAKGPATGIGDSLADAFAPYAASSREVSAFILFSDGCNNTSDVIAPDKEALLMGSRGVPIFTVGVGCDKITSATRTLSVRELRAPDEVEAFNQLPITAVVQALGLAGKAIRVTCRLGQQEVGSETYTPEDKEDAHNCRFAYVPLAVGFQRLTVTAEAVDPGPTRPEGQPTDGKLVHVVDRELRILYIEGKSRYEAKYLTQALSAARGNRLNVDRRILLEPLGADKSPALSESPDDWIKYHAIILGDVAASRFTDKQLQIIKDLVATKGKGLCMIGGCENYARGGWAGTPLADVLPVDMAASDGQLEGPLDIVLTPEGQANEIMKIAEKDTPADQAAAWKQLHLPTGASKLGKDKPGAVVLARTPKGDPLVVCQKYDAGRSLAIAFDTTWMWVLSADDTANFQKRFWRQVALYLAAPKGNVWITTDHAAYDFRRLVAGAEMVEVTAGVEDASGMPAPAKNRVITLTDPQNRTTPLKLTPQGDLLKGTLPPPTLAGMYTLRISDIVGDKEMAAEHRFEVLERDLESLDVLANFACLREIARNSNGQFAPLSDLPRLLSQLRRSIVPKTREEITHVDLGGAWRWPLVVTLIALLCLEWAWRKRKGLV